MTVWVAREGSDPRGSGGRFLAARTMTIVWIAIIAVCCLMVIGAMCEPILYPPSVEGNPNRAPVWLPDGSGIIFGEYGILTDAAGRTMYSGGSAISFEYLYSITADGSRLKRLSDPPSDDDWYADFSPRISPDGSRMVFVTSRHTSGLFARARNLEIVSSRPDGTDYRRLTDQKAADTNPVWSRDGKRIAFSSEGSVVIIDQNGSNVRKIEPPPDSSWILTNPPNWSPNGLRLALLVHGKAKTTRNNRSTEVTSLYTVAVDGSDWQWIAETPKQPSWSPDGSRIAFAVQQPHRDYTWKLYTSRFDGSDLQDLYPERSYYDLSNISWSRDGSQIRFSGSRYYDGNDSERYAQAIYSAQIDGSGSHVIIPAPSAADIDNWSMSWSPDDSKIAIRLFESPEALYVVNAGGTNKQVLVRVRISDGRLMAGKNGVSQLQCDNANVLGNKGIAEPQNCLMRWMGRELALGIEVD